MQSIGEAEVMIDTSIVGKVRVHSLSALDALRPRIGLLVGIDLNPISEAHHSGESRAREYCLTDLSGDLRVSERGPAIGAVRWIGPHREVRAFPYPSEMQVQVACDFDAWTLERLEALRDGKDLALWLELWPRLEHAGGYLAGWIRGFQLAVPRPDWLRFLEQVGYGSFELLELRIPVGSADLAHRAVEGLRIAQNRLWAGDHRGALAESRKAIEALETLAPDGKLESLLTRGDRPERASAYASIASKLKALASIAVHDYGRDTVFSRSEVAFVIRTTASLAIIVMDAAVDPARS